MCIGVQHTPSHERTYVQLCTCTTCTCTSACMCMHMCMCMCMCMCMWHVHAHVRRLCLVCEAHRTRSCGWCSTATMRCVASRSHEARLSLVGRAHKSHESWLMTFGVRYKCCIASMSAEASREGVYRFLSVSVLSLSIVIGIPNHSRAGCHTMVHMVVRVARRCYDLGYGYGALRPPCAA